MSLANVIRETFSKKASTRDEDAVQDAIAKELTALAPGYAARRTGYFNHTWAPDLVLSGRDEAERRIFLRFDVHQPEFNLDLQTLADEKPLFVGLATTEASPTVDVGGQSKKTVHSAWELPKEVLVTEAEGLDSLAESKRKLKNFTDATKRVVLDGHGWIDSNAAGEFASSWNRVETSIDESDPRSLRKGLDHIERFLTEPSLGVVESDLLVRWLAAGGAAHEFPGTEEWKLSEREPHEIARYVLALLQDESQPSAAQWTEVANAISLTDLGAELAKLGGCTDNKRVDELVSIAASAWTARFAYAPLLDGDPMRSSRWEFGPYGLRVNLRSRESSFTSNRYRYNRIKRNQSLPSVREMQQVLADRDVIGVGLVTSQANVSLMLRATATESVADQIATQLRSSELGTGFSAASVRTMELRIPSANTIAEVEFDRSVIKSRDALSLATFSRIVAKFVAGVPENELDELLGTE